MFLEKIKGKGFPEKNALFLQEFYEDYQKATGKTDKELDPWFSTFLQLLHEQILHPYAFEPFHKAIRAPFDYWQFGQDLVKPLVAEGSSVIGRDVLELIEKALAKKENVVLLSNHQTEMDPQIMGCLLEKTHPSIVDKLIFVAGQKVITDPVAIPFSMGCNLLCIYSRRYIDIDLATKAQKQEHNANTMRRMSELLQEGGKCIYVAPSGGRDRRNAEGELQVASFEPDSVEMFRLMALKSGTPCHFIPFALMTYDMLPPPETVELQIGEKRPIQKSQAHLYFGPECFLEKLGGEASCKHERRANIAKAVWAQVVDQYHYLENL
ncbi:MAG: 1-acyl-sn-glycerol-3-phosphate acyltransferase [Chlamydiota bacterium]